MTTLIHKLCLSQSPARPLSHLIYLATTNMWPAHTEDKHNKPNFHGRALHQIPQQRRLLEVQHVIQQTFLSWKKKQTDSGGADSQMGGQTDRKHTHVGLISRSGWSDRSSPSGSTRCPFQQSSEAPIGQGCEERLVRWQRG